MTWLGEAWAGARLATRLPRFLRHPFSVEDARTIVAARLASREASFLDVLRRRVYERPTSPYRALLEHARCGRVILSAWSARTASRGLCASSTERACTSRSTSSRGGGRSSGADGP